MWGRMATKILSLKYIFKFSNDVLYLPTRFVKNRSSLSSYLLLSRFINRIRTIPDTIRLCQACQAIPICRSVSWQLPSWLSHPPRYREAIQSKFLPEHNIWKICSLSPDVHLHYIRAPFPHRRELPSQERQKKFDRMEHGRHGGSLVCFENR